MRAISLGVLLSVSAFAQQPPAAGSKPSIIEGRVFDANTGAPLRKTALTLRPVGQRAQARPNPQQQSGPLRDAIAGAIQTVAQQTRRQYSAVTDGEGRYSITVDQAGDYRVSADHTGYVRGEFGARRPGAGGKTVSISDGARLTGIDVKLTPHGVIAGRVVDEDGDPLERAQVTATTRLTANGAARSFTAVTNDLGEFRIAGLASGKYFLMANRIGNAVNDAAAQLGQETFAVTYFPGATDSASAATISVAAGQQVTGIFIPMRKSRVFKVTGSISGSIGDEQEQQPAPGAGPAGRGNGGQARRGGGLIGNRVIVNLVERTESSRNALRRTLNGRVMNADGTFEISNVPPGSYWATAISPQRGAVVVGRTAVDVRNGNVTGIVVPVGPPVTITGMAKADGRETLSVVNARILLAPLGEVAGIANGQVQANGSFQIPTASRSHYKVTAQGLPSGAYLKAVMVNGQDVTKGGLDLSNAPAALAIELVFSSKAASVSGTVKLEKDNLPGQALLVADPYVEGDPASAPIGTPIAVSDAGTFAIRNVPPGSYRLYVFEDVDFGTVDAALLRRLESQSTKLTLAESATATIEPKLISVEESSDGQ